MPKVSKVRTHGAMECWSIGVVEKWNFGGMGKQECPTEMVLTQLHPGEMGKQLHFTGLAGRTKSGIHEGEKAGILEQGDKKAKVSTQIETF